MFQYLHHRAEHVMPFSHHRHAPLRVTHLHGNQRWPTAGLEARMTISNRIDRFIGWRNMPYAQDDLAGSLLSDCRCGAFHVDCLRGIDAHDRWLRWMSRPQAESNTNRDNNSFAAPVAFRHQSLDRADCCAFAPSTTASLVQVENTWSGIQSISGPGVCFPLVEGRSKCR